MNGILKYLWIIPFVGLNKLVQSLELADWVSYAIPALLILVLGLPHGATDHLLSNYVKTQKVSGKVTPAFLVVYLSIIICYALLWWLSPALSLVIFLFLSAYHFGETQWMRDRIKAKFGALRKVHYFLWGMTILGILFVWYTDQTTFFLSNLFDEIRVVQMLELTRNYLLPGCSLIMVILTVLIYSDRSELLRQTIAMILFITLFVTTDLIYGFAVFFALYHSRDTITIMIDELKKSSVHFDWKAFARHSWPFTILSIFGIGMVMVAIYWLNYQVHFITLFFIMISLVTAPHMWVIERFYSRRT